MEQVRLISSMGIVKAEIAVASMTGPQKDSVMLNDTMRMAIGREVSENDFLYFAFVLAHLGRNNNGDIFEEEELMKDVEKRSGLMIPSWKTPEGEPIDNDHDFSFPAIVGDIYQSVYVKEPADKGEAHIKCAGVIYKGFYPDIAFKVARGSRLGYAKMSMECKFLHGLMTHDGRVLKSPNFKGAALTRMPADDMALIDKKTSDSKKTTVADKEELLAAANTEEDLATSSDQVDDKETVRVGVAKLVKSPGTRY